jgi:hypothetical protein
MLGTIGSPYGALGHLISMGEYSGVSCSVKGGNGGDKNIFLGTMRVSRVSVDSFWFKK